MGTIMYPALLGLGLTFGRGMCGLWGCVDVGFQGLFRCGSDCEFGDRTICNHDRLWGCTPVYGLGTSVPTGVNFVLVCGAGACQSVG